MILITGGAGFIGSNVVAALAGGLEVAVCDRLGRGDKWRNLARVELADFVEPEQLFDFLEKNTARIEAILHFGAISATTETDGDLIMQANFGLSLALWDWCTANETRLIYASSAATYGDGAMGFDDEGSVEGLARLRPLNLYGWSKHLLDRRIARIIARDEPRPRQGVGLKFFNVYGPNEYHKGPQRSVAHQLFPAAAAGRPSRLFRSHHADYADGGQLRDFIWVGDVVDVVRWFLDNPRVCGLFNVGTGLARSFKDLAVAAYAAFGREPMIEYVDTPVELRDKYQYFTQARMERLRACGYAKPFTSLEDGVTRYLRDHLAAPDPYV